MKLDSVVELWHETARVGLSDEGYDRLAGFEFTVKVYAACPFAVSTSTINGSPRLMFQGPVPLTLKSEPKPPKTIWWSDQFTRSIPIGHSISSLAACFPAVKALFVVYSYDGSCASGYGVN